MPKFLHEDDKTFTVDFGAGPQRMLKTPYTMAPGGVYESVKPPQKMADGGIVVDPTADPYGMSAFAAANPEAAAQPLDDSPLAKLARGEITMTGAPNPSYQPPAGAPQPPMDFPAPFVGDQQTQALTDPVAQLQQSPQVPQQAGAQSAGAPQGATDQNADRIPAAAEPATQPFGMPGLATVTNEQTKRTIVDPTALAGATKALSDQAAAEKEKGRITQSALEEKGKLYDQQANIYAQQQVEAEKHAAAVADLQQRYNATIPKMIEEYAKQGIHPKQIFEDGNIGQNIAAGIAISLGAMGQALTGAKDNPGLKVINDAIDRDLAAQKVNLEKNRDVINMTGVAFKAAQEMGMDSFKASMFAKATMLNQTAEKMNALAANSGSQLAVQNAAQESAKLQGQAAELVMKATAKEVSTETQHVPLSKLMGEPQKFDPENQKQAQSMEKADRLYSDVADAYDIANGKGLTGFASGRLEQLKGRFGLQGVDSAKLQQRLAQTLVQMGTGDFGHRFTENEQAMLKPILPNMAQKPEVFRQELETLRSDNSKNYHALFKPYPYQRDYMKQPLLYDQQNPQRTSFQPN